MRSGETSVATAPDANVQRDISEDVQRWLRRPADDAETLAELDKLVSVYGAENLKEWKDEGNKHKHRIAHLLARNGWLLAMERAIKTYGFDPDVQRESDLCTPCHLAIWFKKDDMVQKLWDLGARADIPNKYGETADEKWQAERERYERMVFLDLEWSREPKKIMEVAMLITAKNMTEIERGRWVIGGLSKAVLEAQPEFHQEHYRDAEPGGEFPPLPGKPGNGLFSDVLKSWVTKTEVERAMVKLLLNHCPEKACPLVGYSIQNDKELLMTEMHVFYSHVSHQIVDLSTVLRLGANFVPNKMKKREIGPSKYNHRAMHDVEETIEGLVWIRDNLFLPDIPSA